MAQPDREAPSRQVALHVLGLTASELAPSIDMLTRACYTLGERCIQGITANQEICRSYVENSIGLVTALNPILGYEKSSEIANQALQTGSSVYEIVLQKGYLSQEELEDWLKPENMTRPRYRHR